MRTARACACLVVAFAAAPAWTVQTSGVLATLRGVSAASNRVAWASGSGSTVLHTTDGGLTWQKVTVTADRVDFRDIDAVNEQTAYLLSIGNGPASRIYKTTDGGASWTAQFLNQDPKVFLDAMTFWDDAHGLVIGDSIDGQFCLFQTEDAGKTWARVPPTALPPALPNEGAFAASGTNIAVFGSEAWIGTGAAATARVLHTRDRGRTWTVAPTPLVSGASAGIFSVAFRDPLHGVVVGGDYSKERDATDNLAVTSDGGATWTLIRDQALSGFRSVVAYQPGVGTTLVAVGPQGADWSTDDGHSWTPIPGPGFHTFSFSPTGQVGWGAGGRGAIGRLDANGGARLAMGRLSRRR
jgi:photosystem II stability/assembly factor-like uncharacterized protein